MFLSKSWTRPLDSLSDPPAGGELRECYAPHQFLNNPSPLASRAVRRLRSSNKQCKRTLSELVWGVSFLAFRELSHKILAGSSYFPSLQPLLPSPKFPLLYLLPFIMLFQSLCNRKLHLYPGAFSIKGKRD